MPGAVVGALADLGVEPPPVFGGQGRGPVVKVGEDAESVHVLGKRRIEGPRVAPVAAEYCGLPDISRILATIGATSYEDKGLDEDTDEY